MHLGREICVTLAVGSLTPEIFAGSFYDMVLKFSVSFGLVLYVAIFCCFLIGREALEMPPTGNSPPDVGENHVPTDYNLKPGNNALRPLRV